MSLYIIGLGLWDEKDISFKGLQVAKNCEEVYLENYTSILFGTNLSKISSFIGKNIISLNRKAVEQDKIFLKHAKEKDVALLVGGDPLSATTHMEIISEAKKLGIKVKIIHNASIYTAVAQSGLFLYKFGKACSIPFWQDNFKPTSFYDIIVENQKIKAHTLVFLDLKPEENKFMTINQALEILLQIGKERKKEINEETLVIGLARMGSENQYIKAGKIKNLINFDFGLPLHILVIPGELNSIEEEFLKMYLL